MVDVCVCVCVCVCVHSAANKPILLQLNLLDKVLPFAVSPMSTVIFKLLGTLRMAVDGQSKNFQFISLQQNCDSLLTDV